jgi:hypothetical protein
MKSHDCHVFIQTLIPLAFRDLLPKGIWDALMEISHFFSYPIFDPYFDNFSEKKPKIAKKQ